MQPTPLEHARFRVLPRQSDQLAIFFSGSSTPDHEFRWWKIGNRVDASVILVNNGPNQWYQGGIDGLGDSRAEVTDTFRAWADHLGARRLYAIGTSMGGTGAMLHGVPLGARVLAFASETRMNWPWSNVRRLMQKDFLPELADLRPLIAQAAAPVHIYVGECEPVDLVSASHVADLPMVQAVSMKRVMHGPPSHLLNRGRLDPLIDAFLADADLPAMPEAGRGLEGGYAEALYDAYCSERDRRWGDVVEHAADAIQIYPKGEYAHFLHGRALLQLNRYAEAEKSLGEAIALHRHFADAHLYHAGAVAKQGRLVEAVELYKTLEANTRVGGRANYAIAHAYWGVKRYKSALVRYRMAAAMDPHREEFAERLAAVERFAAEKGIR